MRKSSFPHSSTARGEFWWNLGWFGLTRCLSAPRESKPSLVSAKLPLEEWVRKIYIFLAFWGPLGMCFQPCNACLNLKNLTTPNIHELSTLAWMFLRWKASEATLAGCWMIDAIVLVGFSTASLDNFDRRRWIVFSSTTSIEGTNLTTHTVVRF